MQLLFRLHVVGISLKSQMTSEELQSRGLSPSPMQLVKELWGLQPPQLPHLCMPKFMIWVHVCNCIEHTECMVSQLLILFSARTVPRDHNLCSEKTSWSQSSSQFHITMQDSVKALHQFLPNEFSNKFRTPCWYSSYHIPSWVSDIIKDSRL